MSETATTWTPAAFEHVDSARIVCVDCAEGAYAPDELQALDSNDLADTSAGDHGWEAVACADCGTRLA